MKNIFTLFLVILNAVGYTQCPSWMNKPVVNQILPTQNLGLATGWVLHPGFSDDFNGSSLNTTKWSVHDQECHGMSDFAYFKNDQYNVSVSNGRLNLRCKQDIPFPCSNGQTLNYSTGWVRMNTPNQYGYIEIKCKMPNEALLNPCFWMWGGPPGVYDEIDVWEYILEQPINSKLRHNVAHDLSSPNQTGQNLDIQFDQPFTGNDIVIAVEWLPYEINYYINGKVTACAKYTNDMGTISPQGFSPRSEFTCVHFDNASPQNYEVSLALRGITSNLTEPYEIDYVRSYKLMEGLNGLYWPSYIATSDANLSKVHLDIKLGGDAQHTADVPIATNINVWAHNSVTLDKGFTVYNSTTFTARTVRTAPSLFIQSGQIQDTDNN